MDNFFTWQMLATFTGCMAGTVILTEFAKKLFKNFPAQLISFVFAFAILVVGQLVSNTFTWNDILLDAVNAVAVSLSANGGFDAIKGLFGKKEDPMTGAVVLDEQNPANSYIELPKEPSDMKDGEKILVSVRTIKTE